MGSSADSIPSWGSTSRLSPLGTPSESSSGGDIQPHEGPRAIKVAIAAMEVNSNNESIFSLVANTELVAIPAQSAKFCYSTAGSTTL